MQYYLLGYKADVAEADRNWIKENSSTCCLCGHYEDKLYDPIIIQYLDSSCAVGSVNFPGLYYFRLNFLDALYDVIGQEITSISDRKLGSLISNKTGKVLKNWKTLWIPQTVYLRGTRDVSYWQCQTCGQIIYSADFRGEYLVEVEVRERPLVKSRHSLFIREDIYEKLRSLTNWQKMKRKIAFDKVDVLKTPLDGFPEILSQHKPPILDPKEVRRQQWEKAQKIQQERQAKRKRRILPDLQLTPELAKEHEAKNQLLDEKLDELKKLVYEKFKSNLGQ
jgi:hypothetical protein